MHKLSFVKLGLLFSIITVLNTKSSVALKCYSCSTKSGDTFCGEDVFNDKNVKVIQCPPDADVCVRLKQTDGSIFRSCGTSQSAMNPEKINFGYVPLKNTCINYNSIQESVFPDVEFEMCSCSTDLSNGKGDMKC